MSDTDSQAESTEIALLRELVDLQNGSLGYLKKLLFLGRLFMLFFFFGVVLTIFGAFAY